MARIPTAAEALFGHLPHRSDDVAKRQDNKATVAEAMYPGLTQRAKAWDAWRERDRQSLLKALRETTARLRER